MFFIETGQNEEIVEGYEPEQFKDEKVTFDFAHILYSGMQIGFSEQEVCHMYYGKWAQLFEKYKHEWNMRIKKIFYAEKEEETSVLSL